MNHASKTKFLRAILVFGAVFNIVAAIMLAFPTTLGKIGGLPEPGTIFYNTLLAYLVALLGVVFAWMSRQVTIDRSLLTLASIAKIGIFFAALYCYIVGAIGFIAFSVGFGDLFIGSVFAWWLLTVPGRQE